MTALPKEMHDVRISSASVFRSQLDVVGAATTISFAWGSKTFKAESKHGGQGDGLTNENRG